MHQMGCWGSGSSTRLIEPTGGRPQPGPLSCCPVAIAASANDETTSTKPIRNEKLLMPFTSKDFLQPA